ncbi:MAG TPA: hypothetical protein DCE80_16435 [Ignavibacteriales bacterium]|nr:hypothetical protein [Ignavibacteriales bacterium]
MANNMRMLRIKEEDAVYPELSYKICGLCFKAHNQLGRFRNEKQYSDFFEELLKGNRYEYIREKSLLASFKGEAKNRNIPDFIIDGKVVVDFKAKDIVTKDDYYQMRRYLVSANKKLGLIVNFRQKVLYPKRILNKDWIDSQHSN